MANMLSRRDLVGKLAAGTAAAWLGMAGTSLAVSRPRSLADDQATPVEPTDAFAADAPSEPRVAAGETVAAASEPAPAPWHLIRPLTIGSAVAHGWRVADLSGVVNGACVVTLQNASGRRNRVHVCRNDGRPQGIVYTERLDLLVMNGGAGDLPTEEGFAQAVAELGHVLAANERHRDTAAVIETLLPHGERLERYASAATLR